MSPEDGSCLLKDCSYKWHITSKEEDTILCHLLKEHKIVIADIHTVYDVSQYCKYWSNKIHSGNLQKYMHGINVHPKDNSSPHSYFMLNNTSNEDSCLRHKIHHDKLQKVLRQQQLEREKQDFEMKCLFCPEVLTGDRFNISQHLYQDHSFTLGHPDNLVYTAEFVEHLRAKMAKFECLYCDKTFRDYKTLREHMRKKLHKKLNPSNKEFDKYYVVNYREFGKGWKHLENDTEDIIDSRHGGGRLEEEDWSDWEERNPDIKCLICDVSYCRFSDVKHHMESQHHLDVEHLTANLSYYKQVKLINYIRYMTADGICPYCKEKTSDKLNQHLTIAASYNINISDTNVFSSHDKIPEELYDDERYLFPALDDDFLLCCLQGDTVGTLEDEPVIIPEPVPDVSNSNIGTIT